MLQLHNQVQQLKVLLCTLVQLITSISQTNYETILETVNHVSSFTQEGVDAVHTHPASKWAASTDSTGACKTHSASSVADLLNVARINNDAACCQADAPKRFPLLIWSTPSFKSPPNCVLYRTTWQTLLRRTHADMTLKFWYFAFLLHLLFVISLCGILAK